MHVGGTGPFEDPGALQLDVLGTEVVEETAALAEEHLDEVDLDLVEEASTECEPRGCGAGTSTFLSPAACLAWIIAVSISVT